MYLATPEVLLVVICNPESYFEKLFETTLYLPKHLRCVVRNICCQS